MRKGLILVIVAGAAAALLLRRKGPVVAGFYPPEVGSNYEEFEEYSGLTAGDLESNIIEDTAGEVMSMFTNWPAGSAPYRDTIEAAAVSHAVPVEILAWLLWKESRYRQEIIDGRIKSPAGAMGIAQFMPATAAEELGSAAAALDPAQAIPGAARYLRKLFNRTGTWAQALAAYNWGIGNVTRKGIGAAPAETRDYYASILARANNSGGVYA